MEGFMDFSMQKKLDPIGMMPLLLMFEYSCVTQFEHKMFL